MVYSGIFFLIWCKAEWRKVCYHFQDMTFARRYVLGTLAVEMTEGYG
jgi:hypothetical protein